MKEYKVFYESRDLKYAIVEANSAEEAEELADLNFKQYKWHYDVINTSGDILVGEAKEIADE